MDATRKLLLTVVLFAAGLALVFVASAVREAWPLFVAWVPLLAVPYLLTRPERGLPAIATEGSHLDPEAVAPGSEPADQSP